MHDVVDQQRIRPNKDCTFSVGHRLRRLPSHITDPSLIGDLFVSFAVACGFIGGGVAVHFGEARADQMDCNVQESPEPKKPCKGILKTSSSFDKHSVSQRRKSTKFDELNVLQTYHPADKDYGHMKIEEPKTPFNYANPDEHDADQLDAQALADRLKVTEPRKSFDDVDGDDSSSDDEYSNETDEERQRRLEFELRRKKHYNEFEAIKLARKLIEEDEDEDAGDDRKGAASSAMGGDGACSSSSGSASATNEQSTSQSNNIADDKS